MGIEKDIEELLKAEVITDDTASKIRNHYALKKSNSSGRLFVIFGILGAVLVGLGIILIIAHNWDELSRPTKTFLAFTPLVLGQIVCGYVLIKRPESTAWREGGAVFLFLAVGACMSLVSQIYNIMGNLNDFLFTWMLLCFPLIYVLRSSMSSLFYITGITAHVMGTGYGHSYSHESLFYWPMLVVAILHYYWLYKKSGRGNFFIAHSWFLPLSFIISLGTLADKFEYFMFLAYASMFGLFFLLGRFELFRGQALRNNGYLVLGSLGMTYILMHLSFAEVWSKMSNKTILLSELIISPELIISIVLSFAAIILLVHHWRNKVVDVNDPFGFVFLIFIPVFIIGIWWSFSVILINVLVLVLGIWIVRLGARSDHLGQLNFGLAIISLLIICRFFDTDLSFVLRGVLFVLLGLGFFVANRRMLKKRSANEE